MLTLHCSKASKPMKTLSSFLLILLFSTFMHAQTHIQSSPFGTLPDGRTVQLFSLKNAQGMEVRISNYGGIITHMLVPNKQGKVENVTLNRPGLAAYVENNPFFGALVGRFGNRIAKGSFTLDGNNYQLFINNGPNALHGGKQGFDKKLWDAKILEGPEPSLQLHYRSPDMEEGYPGNLDVWVTYALGKDNALSIQYQAQSDKKTIINLTNHAYFNLSGDFSKPITQHQMHLMAPFYLPVDAGLIPTGEIRPVKGSAFDFLQSQAIGTRIDAPEEQIQRGGGYDHCWVFDKKPGELALAAKVLEPSSGRVMEVLTTEPGVQFYTGNFLNGKVEGAPGQFYQKRSGFCLETQHFPDSPNKSQFPSPVLSPGERYQSTTIYRFSVQ